MHMLASVEVVGTQTNAGIYYLHLNLGREQRAMIRAPAPGPQFDRYRPCSPS